MCNIDNGMYFPSELAANQTLDRNQKALYSIYHYFTFYGDGSCHLTNDVIAERLGLNERTMRRAKSDLKTNGWIETNGGIKVTALKRMSKSSTITEGGQNDHHNGTTKGVDKMTTITEGGQNDHHNDTPKGGQNDHPRVDKNGQQGGQNDHHNKENKESNKEIINISPSTGSVKAPTQARERFDFVSGWDECHRLDDDDTDRYDHPEESPLLPTDYTKRTKKDNYTSPTRTTTPTKADTTPSVESGYKVVTEDGNVFYTPIPANFQIFDKYDLPKEGRLVGMIQLAGNNLSRLTRENPDAADTYFRYYVGHIASRTPKQNLCKFPRYWNTCIFTDRYNIKTVTNNEPNNIETTDAE